MEEEEEEKNRQNLECGTKGNFKEIEIERQTACEWSLYFITEG